MFSDPGITFPPVEEVPLGLVEGVVPFGLLFFLLFPGIIFPEPGTILPVPGVTFPEGTVPFGCVEGILF